MEKRLTTVMITAACLFSAYCFGTQWWRGLEVMNLISGALYVLAFVLAD